MFKRRLKRLLALLGAIFLILTARLFHLQLIRGWMYRADSLSQVEKIKEIPSRRGAILDRNGEVLATSESRTFDVAIIPKKFNKLTPEESATALKSLASLYNLNRHDLETRIMAIDRTVEKLRNEQKDAYGRKLVAWREEKIPHSLIRGLPLARAAAVEVDANRFGFLVIKPNYQRKSPFGETGCHIVGYLWPITKEKFMAYRNKYDGSEFKAYHATEFIGRSGIEVRANNRLRGERGVRFVIVDYRNRTQDVLWEKPPVPGKNVQLTLDVRWQGIAEEELARMGRKGAMVIMDPYDGSVIAAASIPRFKPATVRKYYKRLSKDPDLPLINRALYGLYPMGSVFKVVVALAGLEEKVATPNKTYVCDHKFKLGRRTFGCLGYHGYLDLHNAIRVSCNIFFYKLALDIKPAPIAMWANSLGLGRPGECELGGDVKGFIPSPSNQSGWSGGDTVNLSIGQGRVLASPLQVARMMAAFANGGFLVTPRILEHTPVKKVYLKGSPQLNSHVLSICKSMRAVVTEGTARKAGSSVVRLAGKTGTAQAPLPDNARRKHGWFAGFSLGKSGKPAYSFAVIIEQISSEAHGGDTAGVVARKVFERIELSGDRQ